MSSRLVRPRQWWGEAGTVGFVRLLGGPLSLLYLALLTHALEPTAFGRVAIALAVSQFVAVVSFGWTANSVIRFGREELTGAGVVTATSSARLSLTVASLLCALGALGCVAPWLERSIGLWNGAGWWIGGLVVSYGLGEHLLQLLQAAGRLTHFAIGSLVRASVLVGGALGCVAGWLPGTPAIILGIEITSYLAMALWASQGLGGVRWLSGRVDPAWARRLVAYSWTMVLCVVSGYVTNWVDLYIIRLYASIEQVGIYAVAYQLMQYLSTGLLTLAVVFFPQWVSWHLEGRRGAMVAYLQRLTPQVAMGWSLALLVGAAIAEPAARFAVGGQYLGAVWPFLVLLIGVQFQVLSVMTTSVYSAFGWLPTVTLLGVVMAAANVGLDLWLVPRWGIGGAATATATVYAGIGLLYLTIAQHRLGISSKRAILFPVVGAIGIAAMLVQASAAWRIGWLCAAGTLIAWLGRRWGLWAGIRFDVTDDRDMVTPSVEAESLGLAAVRSGR